MPVTESPVAIITGGGSGIGLAAGRVLTEQGYRVVLAGHIASTLEHAAASFGSTAPGDAVETRILDVTNAPQVQTVFEEVADRHGRIDLLINSAGVFTPQAPFAQTQDEQWQRSLDVNVTGSFNAARAAFRQMTRQTPQGGRIINLGSVSAQVPRPQATAYTVSKSAITGLTRSLALEGRDLDIAVGQLDIGNASTQMAEIHTTATLQADGSYRAEPAIDVEHVANTIAFIANLPPTVNIPFLTLMATGMPLMGRG